MGLRDRRFELRLSDAEFEEWTARAAGRPLARFIRDAVAAYWRSPTTDLTTALVRPDLETKTRVNGTVVATQKLEESQESQPAAEEEASAPLSPAAQRALEIVLGRR
jgi:hypothetical protein